MAGVALGDIDVQFAWQAWHLATSTCIPRGVALGAIDAICIAGVALMALGGLWCRPWFPVTPLHFVWQAWHLTSTCNLRGGRGTYGAGLALGGMLGSR